MADLQRKTANLFDKSKRTDNSRVVYTTGEIDTLAGVFVSDFTPIEPNTTYTLNIVSSIAGKTGHLFALYDENKNFVNTGSHEATLTTVYTFTTPSNVAYIRFNGSMASADEIMLNTGSTALPYEPYGWVHSLRKLGTSTDTITTLPVDIYADGNNATVGLKGNTVQNGAPNPDNPIQPQGCGDLETVGAKAGQYKIPISSASTTTPVYLGEVESTRLIKKLVFDGTENWTNQTLNRKLVSIAKPSGIPVASVNLLSTHFVVTSSNNVTIGTFYVGGSWINFNYDNDNDLDTWKSYLAAQYAAGTPVTVWYVLATEETGIVNEPLMRIGDYADTVSGITVQTITGKDTFDVETTLKPSEVSLSYTGWHDATVKECDGSQWNE